MLSGPQDPCHAVAAGGASADLGKDSKRALMATMTVLADMSTAPMAGLSKRPQEYRTPAASGMARTL